MRKRTEETGKSATELLKDLLIVELAKGGVGQAKIREIVGCDMNRVNRIVKHMGRKRRDTNAQE